MGALQHGVSAECLVALLNGNVSPSGVDLTPFKYLGVCLSRLGESDRRMGGSLTDIIQVRTACLQVCVSCNLDASSRASPYMLLYVSACTASR